MGLLIRKNILIREVLGKGGCTKSDEFSEKFQTAFDPPLILENCIAIFFMTDMVAYMRGGIMAR